MRLALAVLASLVLAQPAAAATATAAFAPGDGKTRGDAIAVDYDAAPGEANRLTIRTEPAGVRFLDEALLTAGEGCRQTGEREAFCSTGVGSYNLVRASLGDGDDRATVAGPEIWVDGGPGADELVGGAGRDTLDGGPGADHLRGGGGDDLLLVLEGAPGEAAERLEGGAGTDTLSFAGARAPAYADLAAGRGRLAGQPLVPAGLEALLGSPLDDRLLGAHADDRIYGDDGDDMIDGRRGDDLVTGGGGRDTVRGGPGDDELELADHGDPYGSDERTPGNAFDCGPGADTLETLNDLDTVTASCEDVARFSILADPRRRAPAHLVLAGPECDLERCREQLLVDTVRGRRPRTRLVTRRYLRRPDGPARRVRLGRTARATLRRERARRILVRVEASDVFAAARFLIRLG